MVGAAARILDQFVFLMPPDRLLDVDRGSGLAMLDLGEGLTGALRLKPDRQAPPEGAKLQVEVAIEPQGPKVAVVRALDEGQGAPRLLEAAPALDLRLSQFAPDAQWLTGRAAREAADEAQSIAVAIEHPLPGGGSIAVETTRALTSVDVDLGAGGARDAKRAARQANLAALALAARILRLKAQGGLVVFDLVGRGHDGQAIAYASRAAFAPDQPGVVMGPISRLGTLEFALPRRLRPLSDILCQGGQVSAATRAFNLLRAAEREAQADPGGRVRLRAAPGVAAAAQAYLPLLQARYGARFELAADAAMAVDAMEVSCR